MILLDGEPVTVDDLASLGLYNYGHFTSMLVDHGRVRGLEFHLRRLVNDCRTLFGFELAPDAIRRQVRHAVTADVAMVRVTVYAPELELGHPGKTLEPRLLVTSRPATTSPPPPVRVKSTAYSRDLPHVKHVGLFATILHRRAAQLAGFDDVLFVDDTGRISEGATWNIGFVSEGRLVWPNLPCLPGVTMELLRGLEFPSSTTVEVNLAGATTMPVAFATSAAIGVRLVEAIDDHCYKPDERIIRELQDIYQGIVGDLL